MNIEAILEIVKDCRYEFGNLNGTKSRPKKQPPIEPSEPCFRELNFSA